jgi:two-component system sensor histidine kinase TctE
LLALAHAENQSPEQEPLVPIELTALARSVVQDWVQLSLAHHIDLASSVPDRNCRYAATRPCCANC